MPIYTCLHCCKSFNLKPDHIRHLNRKNPCNPSLENLKTKNKCNFCCKSYTQLSSLTRHQKTCFEFLKKQNEDTKVEIKQLKKMIRGLKIDTNKNNTIIDNSTNNTTYNNDNSTNNTTNNNTINIIINDYGKERLDYITDELLEKFLFTSPSRAPIFCIEAIHLNDKYPENQNIELTNIKSDFIYVRRNGKWVMESKKKIIDEIIINKTDILSDNLEENFDEYKIKYPPNKVNGIKKVIELIQTEDKTFYKDIKDETMMKFANNNKNKKVKTKK